MQVTSMVSETIVEKGPVLFDYGTWVKNERRNNTIGWSITLDYGLHCTKS